jgi:hypothetical protein
MFLMLRNFFLLVLLAVVCLFAAYYLHHHGFDTGSRAYSHQRGDRRHEESPSHRPHEGRREGGPGGTATVECNSQYFSKWEEPDFGSCEVRMKNGFPVPDPKCTPGGINPSITISTLRDPTWRTRSVRNCETSESYKHIAYRWYQIQKPRINSNQNQVCELDHVVPLELGGADGMGNIWPECGPDAVTLNERYFKQKDHVENYLAAQVRQGRIALDIAQRGIASDWTQYRRDAESWCRLGGGC